MHHFRLWAIFFILTVGVGASDFPAPRNSEPNAGLPMPAEDAAKSFKVPPGFKVQIFAAEPDVQNPIGCAWDSRGRLWVAENYTYAERAKHFDLSLRDRILIFEDADGDGHFDRRTVFSDELQMLTSVELGLGGVYALCPPQLLFIPMQDDHPSGSPEVLLDGFTVPTDNYHNFANGLRWGPDGWLYGRVGASAPGLVGRPGAAARDRVPTSGGIWRYHPARKVFEMLCHGTTNPWGHDWNEFGEGFFTNTVNGHLWHLIPGAHYTRPHTIDPNPYVYQLIGQHADHYHFDTGKSWTESRDGKADAYGGGHAHCGAMIYLGDNWPAKYRGKLFTLNMHGRRLNCDRLEREGSGYVGKHDSDLLFAADPWFRGIDLTYGPDGGVFILDWSDTGECHDSTGVHRTSGRIFKVTHGNVKPVPPFDMTTMSDSQLVKLHEHPNEWWTRMARRVLAERSMKNYPEIRSLAETLQSAIRAETNVAIRARETQTLLNLWRFNRETSLADSDETIRAATVSALVDEANLDWVTGEVLSDGQRMPLPSGKWKRADELSEVRIAALIKLAREDSSALVRLHLASGLGRFPLEDRAALASELVAHREDANDHNLPLLLWYALEPLARKFPEQLVAIAERCELPLTRKCIARRLAQESEKDGRPVSALLGAAQNKSTEFQTDILDGLIQGFAGWRKAPEPKTWREFVAALSATDSAPLQSRIRELSVVFGDGRALDEIKRVALDSKAELETRRAALRSLIDARPPDLRDICEKLLSVRFLNTTAVRGLAEFDDPAIGENLATSYQSFHPSERRAVLETLVARPSFARGLLAAIRAGKIRRGDVTAFDARHIRSFNDPDLTRQLTEVWGEIRDSTEAKRALIAKLKSQLTPDILANADLRHGRALFDQSCAVCHRLFGRGGEIGPDLTGGGRDNLDYLLENIVDPSAVVSADFRMTVATMKSGRVFNGIVTAKSERSLSLKTLTGTETLGRTEIQAFEESSQSMMPDGLLESLNDTQVHDLMSYLMSKTQAPAQ